MTLRGTSGVAWDRTICPPGWTGWVRQVEDEAVFVCGACPRPDQCAEHDRCGRELEGKRLALPQVICLCPDCAEEFYYPLGDGEAATCPVCSLTMVRYTKDAQ